MKNNQNLCAQPKLAEYGKPSFALVYLVCRQKIAPLLAVFVLLGLSACASVDFDQPKEASYAISKAESDQTKIGSDLIDTLAKNAGVDENGEPLSGFMLLDDGVEAFAARLLMAEEAEKTLDAQYYLISNDVIGNAFIATLLSAADRGVRVRLLLDDILTSGYDTGVVALNSHPNFEVRYFNPFASRSVRAGDIFDFRRLNRRMHNKSFTVDNAMTIVGGRNIADEYFGKRKDVNFGDLDVAAIGPVVHEVSNMFDLYWNSRFSLPVDAFAKPVDDKSAALEALRERIEEQLKGEREGIYADALKRDYEGYIATDNDVFEWSSYELTYDSPDKADKNNVELAQSITKQLHNTIDQAEKEFILISPYFVPLKSGEAYFQKLIDKGVKVHVITNSLAANNHSAVHSGYAPSRKRLLKMGVKLHEVRATGYWEHYDKTGNEQARATLHTKAFIVDREKIFIGSFNWDPRSMNINTELGVLINSADIGHEVTEHMDEGLNFYTYEVVLNEDGKLRWIDRKDGQHTEIKHEPDTNWWKRFGAYTMRILPIKSQL